MRISDWSADVCSSDLIETGGYQADGNLGHLLDLRLRDLRCRQPAGGFLQRDQVVAQDLPWRGRSVDDEAVHGIGTFQPRLEKGARNENGQVLEIGGGIVNSPLQIADDALARMPRCAFPVKAGGDRKRVV